MMADRVDVVVIGDGVIGLSTARKLGQSGVRCHVFGAVNHGAASGAAAGLLAPSIGKLRPDVQAFFDASLALYPDFVDQLRPYEPDLALLEGLWDLSGQQEIFYPRDGAIDNGLLTRALRRAVRAAVSCTLESDDPIVSVESGPRRQVRTRSGRLVEAEKIVVAAGAWSSNIAGLPRRLPVIPLKGQMLAVRSSSVRHAIMGDDIYLVPRTSGEVAIGATAEHAGFDTSIVPESIEALHQSAIRICPVLADAPITRTWAGIRPATPDMLPILGPDPTNEAIIYACGHSKNGILLAPATAVSIAALATGSTPPLDIAAFNVDRFPAIE